MQEWLTAINIGAIVAALVTAATAIIGVKHVNAQKSFELLTKQRLDSFNSLKKLFAELRLLTSKPSLNEATKTANGDSHLLEIEKVICQLKSLLPITRPCEFELREAVDALGNEAKTYLKSESGTQCNLEDRRKIVFTFADIYLWTEWNYIQVLYRGRDRNKRKRIFVEELNKNYDRAKKLNARLLDKKSKDEPGNEASKNKKTNNKKLTFFDVYPVEMLTSHQKKK